MSPAAGPTNVDAPTIVLLHGFPTSSHQFRNLIPLLAHKSRVVAPDYPGYGFTEVPAERKYEYTFASLTTTFEPVRRRPGAPEVRDLHIRLRRKPSPFRPVPLTSTLTPPRPARQAPVGYRFALAHPTRITAIIAQNGNMYKEGAAPMEQATPTACPHQCRAVPAVPRVLRTSGVPVLAIWGENDTIFVKAGAEAYRKDAKVLEMKYVENGHFALKTNEELFAEEIQGFLEKHVE
ncbi:hypothetical protein EVG20_g8998 [Dentipellis fragilis]|uniref:AB hydrolase-1 domain-containing protein n=1 Tax=Dentipellis fragilis TaxID=205917 RepID=A0A4Y9Y1L9_9AGAM|nr:hypothetical protein EVG20_g8998 [Dentipellis fragilis]